MVPGHCGQNPGGARPTTVDGLKEKAHMTRDLARLITLSVIMALVVAGTARPAQAFVDDVHGKEWRQLTETVGLSWDQIAQVCPQDGASACLRSGGAMHPTTS